MTEYKNIDVTELNALLAKENIRLIDVRSETEMRQGFIKGADMLPLHLIPVRLHEFDSTVPTVFYCRVGARSAQAAGFAAARGFTEVYNLQGGILAWAQAGLPLVT